MCQQNTTSRGRFSIMRLPSAAVVDALTEHIGGDERNAALGSIKTLRVFLGIFADDEVVRKFAPLVDHDALQATIPADRDVRQYHRVRNGRIRMHENVR